MKYHKYPLELSDPHEERPQWFQNLSQKEGSLDDFIIDLFEIRNCQGPKYWWEQRELVFELIFIKVGDDIEGLHDLKRHQFFEGN